MDLWAFGLGLGSVAATASFVVAWVVMSNVGLAAGTSVFVTLLAVPTFAIAALIVGALATVRAAGAGHRMWVPVTGLVLGAAVFILCAIVLLWAPISSAI